MKCPVCGKYDFTEENSFDICPICGWENDGVQADDHSYAGGANLLSVNEARIEFFLLQKKDVREAVLPCWQRFWEEYRQIQEGYAGLSAASSPEKTKERETALDEVRERYLDSLNHILQDMLCDDPQGG